MMSSTSTWTSPSLSSGSIPIINNDNAQSRLLEIAAVEAHEREVAHADYVDFCFASRLVHGIQNRQRMTHDVYLRYENQALIDHIIATRQNWEDETFPVVTGGFWNNRNRHWTITTTTRPERRDSNELLQRQPSSSSSSSSLRYDIGQSQQYYEDEESMIFDMEL
ncbi:hypothetical protein IV203_034358 [Nitzschia inconspicua]|uniref:Uncharacterized protein n=1 Tax=Nitzschia inconspicua TaxID=303405 RepID=A0A9K3K844_9STRA|nr:hypothetical protein IV203_022831 [Nitzschia inconspicua]KAG7373634.1 hypothetical protein IV203_034358 [Nitzschia inconspicua]